MVDFREGDARVWRSFLGKSISYRQYAAECRSMAEALRAGELRTQLLKIAAEWEALADAVAKRSNQQAIESQRY